MRKSYRVLYNEGTGELTEKKSRFIATLRPVKSEKEAEAFIEEMRKKYWDANHNCYAWVIGEKMEAVRCSDDGEPSGAAGRPMLDVLTGAGICNVCTVVTRYFGGTLLGVGGLVRAYSGAVQEGLQNSRILTVCPGGKFTVDTDYNGSGKLSYLFGQQEIRTLDREYTDRVLYTILVPDEKLELLKKAISETTDGKAVLTEAGEVYYAFLDKEILLL